MIPESVNLTAAAESYLFAMANGDRHEADGALLVWASLIGVHLNTPHLTKVAYAVVAAAPVVAHVSPM